MSLFALIPLVVARREENQISELQNQISIKFCTVITKRPRITALAIHECSRESSSKEFLDSEIARVRSNCQGKATCHNFVNLQKKSNLIYYTRGISPKRVTSDWANLFGLAPGQHSSEASHRTVTDTMPYLTDLGNEPKTYRTFSGASNH